MPSTRAVTTVTPVANRPIARRYAEESGDCVTSVSLRGPLRADLAQVDDVRGVAVGRRRRLEPDPRGAGVGGLMPLAGRLQDVGDLVADQLVPLDTGVQ